MNEPAFAALIARRSLPEIIDTLLALPIAERRALAPMAARLWREVDGGRVINDWLARLPGASTTRSSTFDRSWRQQRDKLSLAVLALCPIAQARQVRWLGLANDDLLLRVVTARDQGWRDAWLRHRLRDELPGLSWALVRRLVREGSCARPTDERAAAGYLQLMVSGLNQAPAWRRTVYLPPSAGLLADPGLLDDEVWRLFDTDSNAFDDPRPPARPADYESWSDALVKLASARRLDRQRLLDASLEGLWKSSNPGVLAGYHRLHARLAPDADELDAREAAYRELLGHRSGAVAGFALRQLTLIARRRPLAAEATLDALLPIFALPTRTAAIAALKLVARLLKALPAEPHAAPLAAAHGALCAALRHPTSAVQQAAAQILCEHAGAWDDGQRAALLSVADELSSLARGLLGGLLGKPAKDGPWPPPFAAGAHGEAADDGAGREADEREAGASSAALNPASREWRCRLQALPPRIRARGGLAGEVDFSAPPPPLAFAIGDFKVLARLPRMSPIASVDDLIDCVAHAIESIASVDEVERMVDGIARLFNDRPPDFAARTQSLLKRMHTGALADARGLVLYGTPNGLRDLVLTWLEGKLQHTRYPFYLCLCGPMRFIDHRLRDLIRHLDRHGALPPLATPTHARGWIEPRILVERLLDYQSRALRPISSDLIQALLRLAPDGRRDALSRAGELRGEGAAAVRWALGGETGPLVPDRRQAALWIAAGRARSPDDDLGTALAPLELRIPWPDVLQAAQYRWQAVTRTVHPHRRELTFPSLDLQVSPTWGGGSSAQPGRRWRHRLVRVLRAAGPAWALRSAEPSLSVPTCLAHEPIPQHSRAVGNSAPWLIEWALTLWPLKIDAALARGAGLMVERLDLGASASEPLHPFLEPLFEVNRPWSELARLTLWLALASRDGDLRRLAIDLLIEGIEDGRAHPHELADVLRRLASGGWLKSSRLNDTLAEVARVSPLHQWTVACVIEAALDVFLVPPGRANVALELLHELLLGIDCGPARATSSRLASIASGKAGLAAKAIRALAHRLPLAESAAALDLVWQARFRRLADWALDDDPITIVMDNN
ncbi:MAG: DUF6493 family protein [Candidatus Accumulibacter sp. UW20]|jgi:hypothetical protein